MCPEYATKPLPGEAAAAARRKATKAKKAKKTAPATQTPRAPNAKSTAQKNLGYTPFNLETYKIHALGDYADHIEQFGSTDCFSTQQVSPIHPSTFPLSPASLAEQGELEHRRVKRFYKRTNKTRFERQIAKQERMERHYRKYINTLRNKTGVRTTPRARLPTDPANDTSPRQHYSIAKRDRDHIDLYALAHRHAGDPALKVSRFLCRFPQSY